MPRSNRKRRLAQKLEEELEALRLQVVTNLSLLTESAGQQQRNARIVDAFIAAQES